MNIKDQKVLKINQRKIKSKSYIIVNSDDIDHIILIQIDHPKLTSKRA